VFESVSGKRVSRFTEREIPEERRMAEEEYRDLLEKLESMNYSRSAYYTVKRFLVYLKDQKQSIDELDFAHGNGYLTHLRSKCKPSTVRNQKMHIRSFYSCVTGRDNLFTDGRTEKVSLNVRFSDLQVRGYLQTLSGYSKSVLKTIETVLSAFCRYLEKTGKKSENLTKEELRDCLSDCFRKRSTRKRGESCLRVYYRTLAETGVISQSPFETETKPLFSPEFGIEAGNYLRICEAQDKSPHSIRSIKNALRILDHFLQERGLDSLEKARREDGREFMIHLADRKKANGMPYYRTNSVNRILSNIRAFLHSLLEKRISCPFVYGLWTLKTSAGFTRNILSRKELALLFRFEAHTTLDFMFKTLFVCQYATGLRIGELLSLKRTDIDFERKTLLVYESKTKKQRFVHIGETGIRYLRIYLEKVRDRLNRSVMLHDRVFVTQYVNTTPGVSSINTVLKRICRKTGIRKEVSTHGFRHSFATHLLENGADIKKIAELLGHHKLSTAEKYTRLSPVHLQRIIARCHPRERRSE
jgi:site-specific recombinase XerD